MKLCHRHQQRVPCRFGTLPNHGVLRGNMFGVRIVPKVLKSLTDSKKGAKMDIFVDFISLCTFLSPHGDQNGTSIRCFKECRNSSVHFLMYLLCPGDLYYDIRYLNQNKCSTLRVKHGRNGSVWAAWLLAV